MTTTTFEPETPILPWRSDERAAPLAPSPVMFDDDEDEEYDEDVFYDDDDEEDEDYEDEFFDDEEEDVEDEADFDEDEDEDL